MNNVNFQFVPQMRILGSDLLALKYRRLTGRQTSVTPLHEISPGTAKYFEINFPHGIYEVGRNMGFMNVGVTYETAEFAVQSLRRWSKLIGQGMYPEASGWLVCAEGGSNGTIIAGGRFTHGSWPRIFPYR